MQTRLFFILCAFFLFAVTTCGQDDIDRFLSSSKRFAFSKKYAQAIEEINKAIEIQPGNADLYLKKAHLYGNLQNRAAALENVFVAISIKPDDVDFLQHCVTALNCSGNYDESLKIAARLILSDDEYKKRLGYRFRYKTRFLLEDSRGAIEDVITAGDIDEAYYDGTNLVVDEDNRTALTDGLLFKILDRLKDDPNIFEYYKELLANIEQMKKREFGSFYNAMMINAMGYNIYARYALVYEEKYTPAETARLLDGYAEENGLESRIEILKAMKKYELAVKDLTEVLKTTSARPSYLLMRGDMYLRLKQYDKAIADYEAAASDKEYSKDAEERITNAKELKNKKSQPK